MLGKCLINQVQKLLSKLGVIAMTEANHFLKMPPQMCQTFLLVFDSITVVDAIVIGTEDSGKLCPNSKSSLATPLALALPKP